MSTHVIVSINDQQQRHPLLPGDLIGRHWNCTLQVAEIRVSEAHAMVSLRGTRLHLLNLRGGLRINGRPAHDPVLTEGMTIELAPGLCLHIHQVSVPRTMLVLVAPGLELPLSRALSILPGPEPSIVPGYHPNAQAYLFSDGVSWFATQNDHTRPLGDGAEVHVGDWTATIRARKTTVANTPETVQQSIRPLRLSSQFTTVKIWSDEQRSLVVSGVLARLIHELLEIDGPIGWAEVAALLWTDSKQPHVLRRRWDTNLARLRQQLRAAGLRTDLIRPDGCGNVELLKYPDDRFEIDD